MKLKTLLLGSAAALMAVTGARAADAIVAEPEPVEYVRVCDMYGAGFFYIPGTETCMGISGYVRVGWEYNDNDGAGSDTSGFEYRGRLNFDVRNETDYGTLRSELRLQGNQGVGASAVDANVAIDRALLHLAGLRLGYSDSWNTTFHGYGTPLEFNDGYYGYYQAVFFDYTYAANGFSFTAGVEAPTSNGAFDDYGYYVGARYAGSWGDIAVSYNYYDAGTIFLTTGVANDNGLVKASTHINLIENLSLNGFVAFDTDDGIGGVGGWVDGVAVPHAGTDADVAWGIGASYAFSDTLRFDFGYSDSDATLDTTQLVAGLRWSPVPGLSIRPTVSWTENLAGPGADRTTFNVRVYRTW